VQTSSPQPNETERKAMGVMNAIFVILTVVVPALTLQFITITSFEENVEQLVYLTRGGISPDDVVSFKSDSKSREHLQNQFNQLADSSLPAIRLCDNFCKLADECIAVPYPLLPLRDSERNALLGRPSPDIVRINIEQATRNELSTVGDLVEKVIANLENFGNLNAMSDDELTLLGSNFHHSKPGWFTGKECALFDDGPWTEDLLMSQDEQRALVAGFLYVFRDPGYRGRQVEALREEIRGFVQRRDLMFDELMEITKTELGLFTKGMIRLDEEEVIIEEEWLARYDEYVTALRKGLQSLASAGAKTQNIVGPQFETLITVATTAEDAVEGMVCSRVPLKDPAFVLFLIDQEDGIQQKFQQIRQGILYKLAYFRWKALSVEEQAVWYKRTSMLPAYSRTCKDAIAKTKSTTQES